MEITYHGSLTIDHRYLASLDAGAIGASSHQYRVNRGITEILLDSYVNFNPYVYLKDFCTSNPGRKPRVIEIGCGIGMALLQLKSGVSIGPDDSIPESYRKNLDIYPWRRDLLNRQSAGLGSQIHTTGLTLTDRLIRHTIAAAQIVRYNIDALAIGPVEEFNPRDRYHLVYDFFGAAYYDPLRTLPKIGLLTEPGGRAFFRICPGSSSPYNSVVSLLSSAGLTVLDEGQTGDLTKRLYVDFVVQKR